MQNLLRLPQIIIAGNPLADWIVAVAVALAVLLALLVCRRFVVARHARYLDTGRSTAVRLLAHLAGETRQFFMIPFAVYVGGHWLTLSPGVDRASSYAMLLLVLAQAGIWASRTLGFLLAEREAREPGDAGLKTSLAIIGFGGRLLVWSIVLLVALDNLGVNITALLAGLGVGGVAVALALQSVLGDLFASLSIALDKPFVLGDSLEIGDYSGVVERIGIKSLRLRSASGEQIILANADVLRSRVRNFGRATERRAIFSVGVPYETPVEKLALIPRLVEQSVASEARVRFERCHLCRFGDFALVYEISFYSLAPTLQDLLDRQHSISLAIIGAFQRNGIEFAYPTHRVVTATT